MSDQLQHRMQTFEVAPPASVWNAIAVRLDDDILHQNFSKKIFTYEVAPPDSAWNAIAVRLDDDILHQNLSKKISAYEVTPPASAWNGITDLLYNDNTANTVHIPDVKVRNISTSRNWYKMAAAAVITALLLGGGWYFANQGKQPVEIADVKEKNATPPVVTNPEKETNTTVENNQHQPLPDVATASVDKRSNVIVADNNNNNNADKSSKKAIEYNPNQDYVISYAKVTRAPSYLEQPIVINGPVLRDENGLPYRDIGVLTNEGKYIVVAGPNGQMTRISAKFANVIQFINSSDDQVEENLDRVLRESGMWKKRFQEWRNKIKQAGYLPAPGNFLDILEFKALIEEK